MAWSWSHTAEAYAQAQANCEALPRNTLLEIAAEWQAHDASPDDSFSEAEYNRARVRLAPLAAAHLAELVWERAEGLATCDNGGWNAWLCPYGCDPHTVPFSPSEDAVRARLDYLRGEIEAERISLAEVAELQGLAEHIDTSDVLLRQWAGIAETEGA